MQHRYIQGGPKIVYKPLPNYQSHSIVLKPANEIRFFRQPKVSNKYNNTTTWY